MLLNGFAQYAQHEDATMTKLLQFQPGLQPLRAQIDSADDPDLAGQTKRCKRALYSIRQLKPHVLCVNCHQHRNHLFSK